MNNKHTCEWEIITHSTPKIVKPILIEGMPGIGNVGKISMDILIEETKAVLIASFYSKYLPNSVFVNEDNLIDLPKLSLYHKRIKNQDYLFLTGDVQPVNEHASYSFCDLILSLFKEYNGKHIVTLGGIGLNIIPDTPKVYITGNNKQFVQSVSNDLKKNKLVFETKIYGMVGPIIGISGLLLGLAKKSNINAYCLLSETLGHPVYVGLKGSKAILVILSKYYSMSINFDKLNKEIKHIDSQSNLADDSSGSNYKKPPEVNYIG